MNKAPTGEELFRQLKEAIIYLQRECFKNGNDFFHLPEFDISYFDRLKQFLDAALEVEKDNDKLVKARELLKSTDGKYFNDVAEKVLEALK